jgi:hypothetical protein
MSCTEESQVSVYVQFPLTVPTDHQQRTTAAKYNTVWIIAFIYMGTMFYLLPNLSSVN